MRETILEFTSRTAASSDFKSDIETVAGIEIVPKMLEVICRSTDLGFAAVVRVTEERWVVLAVVDRMGFGLAPGGELPVETTLCDSMRKSGEAIVIDNVAEDEIYRDHSCPAAYGFQSYISTPIHLKRGEFFGSLVALGSRPANLKARHTVGMFELYSDLISMHLDLHERVQQSEAALMTERETAQVREQFIAVLGHDLRNPLAAVSSAAQILAMKPQDEDDTEVLQMLQNSTGRMSELINNLMDFARGRLGGGLSVRARETFDLPEVLAHVVNELQSAWPTRTIEVSLELHGSVRCDPDRLGQMLSNLIANALTHGDPQSVIRVRAQGTRGSLRIEVSNFGKCISPEVQAQLFQPFVRGGAEPGQRGLGLGLYIASEIARAHHGQLGVKSEAGETTFSFAMAGA